MTKKILCYSPDYSQCFYFRVFLPFRELDRQGICSVKMSFFPRLEDVKEADIVYFQRPVYSSMLDLFRKAKELKKTVIVGNDDALFHLPPSHPLAEAYRSDGSFLKTLKETYKEADGLIFSTEELAKLHKNDNDMVWSVPNFVDADQIKALENPVPGRFLWAGSSSHLQDLDLIRPSFQYIWNKHPEMSLVSIGTDAIQALFRGMAIPKDRVTFNPGTFGRADLWMRRTLFEQFPTMEDRLIHYEYDGWNKLGHRICGMNSTLQEFKSISIGSPKWDVEAYYEEVLNSGAWASLAPLVPISFNRYKSNIRLLDGAMHGIPIIASAFGEYANSSLASFVCHADLGKRSRDWELAFEKCLETIWDRANESQRVLNYVQSHYTIQQHCEAWVSALDGIHTRKQSIRQVV